MDDVEIYSKSICEKIKEMDIDIFGTTVFTYQSFDNEVDTQELIEYFLLNNISVCVPVLIEENEMIARSVQPTCNYSINSFGILEPEKTDVIEKNEILSYYSAWDSL